MKKKIKIDFVDFWIGFDKENNLFVKTLQENYEVVIASSPDILFYSCNGLSHLKYSCKKVFFSCENIRPDFGVCDYALSFDFNNSDRHFRLPLFTLYHDISLLQQPRTKEYYVNEWKKKTKFCCLVVSNASAKERIDFFYKLTSYKDVDSGGKWNNTIGRPVADKLSFIKDYKFVLAFENSSFPGYTTEKVLEPIIENCIPIYWGNPLIGNDFNTERIINCHDFKSAEKVIEYIKYLDENEDAAIEKIAQPVLSQSHRPGYYDLNNLSDFFDRIVNDTEKPISLKIYGRVSRFRIIQWRRLKEKVKRWLPSVIVMNLVHYKRRIKLKIQKALFTFRKNFHGSSLKTFL